MAYIYVRSADGDDGDNGTTWALAKATVAGADAIDSAGDTIALSSTHSESTASAITLSLAGTDAAPTQLLSVNDGAAPPTALSAGASIATTSNSSIIFNGAVYGYGLTVSAGSGTSSCFVGFATSGGANQMWDTCAFRVGSTSATTDIRIGNDSNFAGNTVTWRNSTVRFADAGQGVAVLNSYLQWMGGGLESGGTAPAAIIERVGTSTTGRASRVVAEGLDLSGLGTSAALVGSIYGGGSSVDFVNCKLPTSWAGDVVSGNQERGAVVRMINCDSTDTNYRMWEQWREGSIKSETTLVLTGGSSDGTTTLAWRMATTGNVAYPHVTLNSPWIQRWNETTGSAITVTVEFLHDSATNLDDDEVWLEVSYLGTSGFPLGVISDDRCALLASPAAQTDSSATWTTTGMSAPNTQKLVVTFTPQEKGYVYARVRMAKPSYVLYVDPELTVS